MSELLAEAERINKPPAEVSKSAFAEELGVAKSRVSQLIAMGLPVGANGRIPRREALDWYRGNVAEHRRKAMRAGAPLSSRAALDALKVEKARLDLERARGALVERAAVERVVFARARADRDAWIAWAARCATALAAELGASPGATFAALDRLTREQLAELAESPLPSFGDDG